MTLQQFFERLIEKVSASDQFNQDVPAPTRMRVKDCMLQRLRPLSSMAGADPSFACHQVRDRRDFWKYVVEKAKGTDLFAEFKGNEKLREELKLYLDGKI